MTTVQHFTVNPVAENTYILYDETLEAVIIDPGCYESHEKRWVEQFINSKKLKLTRCLLTHAHFDHIFGCQWVFDTYNLLPEMHKDEQIVWDNANFGTQRFGIPFDLPSFQPLYIEEGQIIKFGNTALNTLFVPGHSPASVCFYSKENDFVIAGDTLFAGAIGRTDLPGGNHDLLLQSIQNQLFTLPPETKVYAGHGGATTIGKELKTNPFF